MEKFLVNLKRKRLWFAMAIAAVLLVPSVSIWATPGSAVEAAGDTAQPNDDATVNQPVAGEPAVDGTAADDTVANEPTVQGEPSAEAANDTTDPAVSEPAQPDSTVNEPVTEQPTVEASAQPTVAADVQPRTRTRRSLQGAEYVVEDNDTADTIKAALANPQVEIIRFSVHKVLDWDTVSISNRNLTIVVDDGKDVVFNATDVHRTSAFNVSLGGDRIFRIDNRGTLTFNNYNRALWIHGGDETSSFVIVGDGKDGSRIDINQNGGYAIGALDNYSGKINFSNTSIHVDASPTNQARGSENVESGLYLGNTAGSGDVVIDNVEMELNTPSNAHTSVPFTSNAKNILIRDSEITSTSKSHYNFEITSSTDNVVQNFVVDHSNIHLVTPADANPSRTVWGFKIPESSIGVNTYNTKVDIINGSVLEHENQGFDEGRTVGVSMSNTEINVNNSTLNIGTLGSQSYPARNVNLPNKGLNIGSGSKVTISDFDTLTSSNLPAIEITGGSVDIPRIGTEAAAPVGTLVVNGNGETVRFFEIPKTNLNGNNTLTITPDTNDPGTTPTYDYAVDLNNVHSNNNTVYAWLPPVTVQFFETKQGATDDEKQIGETIATPRGQTIGLVGAEAPYLDGKQVSWWNAEDDSKYDVTQPVLKNTKVYPDYFPELETEDKTVVAGKNTSPKDVVVSTNDKEDGDLTDRVEVVSDGGFNANVPGTYTITVRVTDSKGNTTEKTAVITVNPPMIPLNEVPTLITENKEIVPGEKINPRDVVKSATDKEDGDLTDQVEVVSDGGFDANKPGTYTITVKVTDKNGSSVTRTATITVKEPAAEKKTEVPTVEKKPLAVQTPAMTVKSAPKTGDENRTLVAAMIALVFSFGALSAAAVYMKKRKR